VKEEIRALLEDFEALDIEEKQAVSDLAASKALKKMRDEELRIAREKARKIKAKKEELNQMIRADRATEAAKAAAAELAIVQRRAERMSPPPRERVDEKEPKKAVKEPKKVEEKEPKKDEEKEPKKAVKEPKKVEEKEPKKAVKEPKKVTMKEPLKVEEDALAARLKGIGGDPDKEDDDEEVSGDDVLEESEEDIPFVKKCRVPHCSNDTEMHHLIYSHSA
jgi:outer membrane biosynthesis protein TonB